MGYISLDIDIDEIIYAMSKYDRKEFFRQMQSDGYISESCTITNEGYVESSAGIEKKIESQSKDDFNLALQRLFNNGWRLTKEEEDYIINVSKKIF